MLTIAEAAAKCGLAASAIRYYEEEGLLTERPIRRAGRRLFDPAAVMELALIGDLRRAGMTLANIKEFQRLRASAGLCLKLSALAADRARLLRAEIMAMRKAEERLSAFSKSCELQCGNGRASGCSELGTISI